MVVNCQIIYDNNTYGIYYAGQVVTGTVKLTLEKVKKIRGLCLKVEGYARCSWTESSGSGKNRRTVRYEGREDYLHTLTYLVGSREGNQIDLAPGIHAFNFSCLLPPMVPTSFEAPHGYIRYTIKVVLERPWKFDLSFKHPFTVIKTLDLNYETPALNVPVKYETAKKFTFSFGGSNFHMSASIPMSGFVAGQSVNFIAEINNQTNVEVVYLKISLRRNIYYNSDTPRQKTKEEMRTVHEMRCSGVKKKEQKNYNENFVIPVTPPTNMNACRVVKVFYELQFKAKVSGMHRSPIIRFPVTIGTIPIYIFPQSQSDLQASEVSSSTFYPVAGPSSQPSPHIATMNMPPPSYEECFGMDPIQYDEEENEDKNAIGQKNFNPRYPVYNFNNSNMNSAPTHYGFIPMSNAASAPAQSPVMPTNALFQEKEKEKKFRIEFSTH